VGGRMGHRGHGVVAMANTPAHAGICSQTSCRLTLPLSQVREDVTRYRYGDEQHLDEALTRIFR